MEGSVAQTWLSDILHVITQGLLYPDIILLIAFIGYALFCIGSIIAEYFTERKHFQVTMPKFLAALMAAEEDEIPKVIEESGLLKRQKIAMLTVYDYRMLPGDALIALIRRLVGEEESRYDAISGRNNMAARVSPMLGLMGTLIPLGPGIQALGKADTAALSSSLAIAFDTTVAGLVVAAVCIVIAKIRGNWYANYMSALDSGMATMLEKIEAMRAEGKIVTKEPSDYAFLFQEHIDKEKAEKKAAKEAKRAEKAERAERAKEADAAKAAGSHERPAEQAATQAAPAPDQARAKFDEFLASAAPVAASAAIPAENAEAAPSQDDAAPVQRQGSGALFPKSSFEPVPDPAFISNLAAAQTAAKTTEAAQPAGEAAPAAAAQAAPAAKAEQPAAAATKSATSSSTAEKRHAAIRSSLLDLLAQPASSSSRASAPAEGAAAKAEPEAAEKPQPEPQPEPQVQIAEKPQAQAQAAQPARVEPKVEPAKTEPKPVGSALSAFRSAASARAESREAAQARAEAKVASFKPAEPARIEPADLGPKPVEPARVEPADLGIGQAASAAETVKLDLPVQKEEAPAKTGETLSERLANIEAAPIMDVPLGSREPQMQSQAQTQPQPQLDALPQVQVSAQLQPDALPQIQPQVQPLPQLTVEPQLASDALPQLTPEPTGQPQVQLQAQLPTLGQEPLAGSGQADPVQGGDRPVDGAQD